MRVVYISHNGMAENLGQSQVLPYLRGCVKRGARVDVVSFELPTLTPRSRDELAADLARDGIGWHPLLRKMGGSLPVKVGEAARGVAKAIRTAIAKRPDIVHGRSYLPTAICDVVAEVSRRPALLFDCRGMLGDEYVDCGYWTKDRLEYRLIKRYERRLFRRSDGIVVLTRALAKWLRDNAVIGSHPTLEVVPCCVDMERFRPSDDARIRVRAELGIPDDALTVLYSGSLGTWYLEDEMARFVAAVRRHTDRRVVLACFTPSDASSFLAALAKRDVPTRDVVVKRVAPKNMPEHLSIGDIGLSFIQSCFSKTGSSPTKVAEYLACGNVAVVNGDIGDQADLASEKDACVVLSGFSDDDVDAAARGAAALASRAREQRKEDAIRAARRHFGLEEIGVARYAKLYDSLVSRSRS